MLLVTGGAGYIGSHFVDLYLSVYPQKEVVVVDNLSNGHIETVSNKKRLKFYNADIGNKEIMERIIVENKIDSVAHFAASIVVSESQSKPFEYYNNNVTKAFNLLDVLCKYSVSKFVLSSTCAVYGDPQYLPLDERHPLSPVNVYGHCKLILEGVLEQLATLNKLNYVLLRYFNASGASDLAELGEAHSPETHLIPNILNVALGKSPSLTIYGNDYDTVDGTCIRDYIHVYDLAQAHILALEYLDSKKQNLVVNLGSTIGHSNLELVNTCKRITGKDIEIIYAKRRAGDAPSLVACSDLAKNELGWSAKRNLDEIISSAWNWHRAQKF